MNNTSEYTARIENAFITMRRNSFQHRTIDSGLKPPEFFLLKLLRESSGDGFSPATPTELAKKMQVTTSAVTHHLNTLENRKLVERQQSKSDRRVFHVKLSARGKRLLQKQRQAHMDMINDFLEYLGPDEAEHFVNIIERANDFFTNKNRGEKC